MRTLLSAVAAMAVLLCCGHAALAAQQAAQDVPVYTLGEVVVTSDKPGVQDMTMHDVITAEEIEAVNAKSVVDALRFAPGIEITVGRKNQPEIYVHGMPQAKTLVLIDGVPYMDSESGKLNLDQIPASIISKIEVTKSAPSVLYGANAFMAVVNIITKKGTAEPTADLWAEMGENSTYRAGVAHGNTVGPINYWLSFERRYSEGWRLSEDYDAEMGQLMTMGNGGRVTEDVMLENGDMRNNSDYDINSMWTRVGYNPDDDTEVFANFHIIDSERGNPPGDSFERVFGGSSPYSTLSRFDTYRDWGVDLSARQVITNWLTLRGKLFYHSHYDEYESYTDVQFDNLMATSTWKDSIVGTSLFADTKFFEGHAMRLSFHYRQDEHQERATESDDFEKYVSFTGSAGMEHEFSFDGWPVLVVGGSYDWYDLDEASVPDGDDPELPGTSSDFNPMAGLTYEFADTTKVYGSVARKTRFPSLGDLFGTYGDKDLKTEKTINYTLGVSRSFLDRMVDVEVAGFYHDISDWLIRDPDTRIYKNIGAVSMQGVESTVRVRPVEDLTLSLSYTYNDANDESDDRVTDRMTGIAAHTVILGADYTIPTYDLGLHVRGTYVADTWEELPTADSPDTDPVRGEDYFLVNSRVTWDFAENYQLYLEVNNVLDKAFYFEDGFPGRGRSFLVGMKASF